MPLSRMRCSHVCDACSVTRGLAHCSPSSAPEPEGLRFRRQLYSLYSYIHPHSLLAVMPFAVSSPTPGSRGSDMPSFSVPGIGVCLDRDDDEEEARKRRRHQ